MKRIINLSIKECPDPKMWVEIDGDSDCVIRSVSEAEWLASKFHANYERLASLYKYETKLESKGLWENVPENNKQLMIAVCERILGYVKPIGREIMNTEQAKLTKRIGDLERRLAALENRIWVMIRPAYPSPPSETVPAPYPYYPFYPSTGDPLPSPPIVTC